MRRWNGWGDESFDLELPDEGQAFLAERIGKSRPLADATLESVCAMVPPTRLPPDDSVDELIDTSPETRVRHARGQSLPDWLAMRSGDFGVFPDGVATPGSSDDVRKLLHYAHSHKLALIPYGGGTSVAGHINPLPGDRPVLTVDMGAMNRLLDLDPESLIATFGAGTPGPLVESQLRAGVTPWGIFPSPSNCPLSAAG